MNDEKKETNPVPAGDRSANASPVEEDGNPWDDDGGGRTLATDGPSFEMPSNIPSPITVPPPPLAVPAAKAPLAVPAAKAPLAVPAAKAPLAVPAAKASPTATLVGLMPEDFSASPPKRAPPSPPKAPASARMPLPPPPSARMPGAATARGSAPDVPRGPPPPVVLSDDDLDELPGQRPGQREDGPTMAVASPSLPNRPLRDDALNPPPAPRPRAGFVPPASPTIDKDAETMALGGDDPRLPLPSPEIEEPTRAIPREEIMRRQDAHVIIGEDAIGDDATLAIAPGQIDLGLLPGGGDLGPSLAEAAQQPPHFPQFPHAVPSGSSGHLQAAPQHMPQGGYGGPGMQPPPQAPPSWQGEGAQSYRNPPQGPPHQGFDPMMAQGPPGMMGMQGQGMQGGQFPPSGQHPAMQGPPQSNPMGWGPPPDGPTAFGPPMQQQGMMQGAPPWMPQPQPLPGGTGAGGFRVTPQIMLLVGVGVVCLAIFVTGIVLFVTTKF